MTPEERARVVMKQAQLAAQLGPVELTEAQEELIALTIREAVEAERQACTEVLMERARSMGRAGGMTEAETLFSAAKAIEARKDPGS